MSRPHRRLLPRLRRVRPLFFEHLETRTLLAADVSPLASPWHNAAFPADVNSDGTVRDLDLRAIATTISNSSTTPVSALSAPYPSNGGLPDVTNDFFVDQTDVDYVEFLLRSGEESGETSSLEGTLASGSGSAAVWISGSSAYESASGGFTVGRSGDLSGSMDVQVSVSDGTATTANNDYVPLSTSVHFDPNESQEWVPFSHVDDLVLEPDENYNIFASTSDAGGSSASGVGWILNDDSSGSGTGSASVWVSGSSAMESSSGGFMVGRSGDLSGSMAVQVSVSDGTATTANNDYVPLNTTVQLAPNESQKWVPFNP